MVATGLFAGVPEAGLTGVKDVWYCLGDGGVLLSAIAKDESKWLNVMSEL